MNDFLLVLIILILPYFLAKILLTKVIFARAFLSSTSSARTRSSTWWNIFSWWSFTSSPYESNLVNPIVRQLFSITFTLSLDSLILAIFEILGILDSVLRLYVWKFILTSLVILLVFILPISCILLIISNQGWSKRMQQFMVFMFESIFLYLFWYIGYLFPIIEHGEHALFTLEGAIGRLGVAGVTASAILSGYGAVATPRAYLAALLHHIPKHNIQARKENVNALFNRILITKRKIKEVEHTILLLKGYGNPNHPNTLDTERILRLRTALQQQKDGGITDDNYINGRIFTSYDNHKKTSSWLSYIPLSSYFLDNDISSSSDNHIHESGIINNMDNLDDSIFFSSSDISTPSTSSLSTNFTTLSNLQDKLKELKLRIKNMEKLHYEAFLEYNEIINAQKQTEWSQTFRGQISTLLGYILSFYAIYKMCMALINIIFFRDPTKDPITSIFELILIYLRVPRNEAALWVQPVSFVFVGILVFTSVRGFLLSFSQAVSFQSIQKLGGFSSVTSSSVILIFAQVMGMYFVSVLLLLRMSMPEEFRRGVTKAMGPIHFNFFHRWFDIIFLLSACITIMIFVLVFKEKGMTINITEADRAAADAQYYAELMRNDDDDDDDVNNHSTSSYHPSYTQPTSFSSSSSSSTSTNYNYKSNNLSILSPINKYSSNNVSNNTPNNSNNVYSSPTLDVLLRHSPPSSSTPSSVGMSTSSAIASKSIMSSYTTNMINNNYATTYTSNNTLMSAQEKELQDRRLLFSRPSVNGPRKLQ